MQQVYHDSGDSEGMDISEALYGIRAVVEEFVEGIVEVMHEEEVDIESLQLAKGVVE